MRADRAFDAGALVADFAFLDGCPEVVFEEVVNLPIGTLAERVSGAQAWRSALLAGELPSPEVWPPGAISRPVRRALMDLGIPRFCKDQPELVDQLLTDIVASFARQSAALRAEVAKKLRDLEDLERERLAESSFQRTRKVREPHEFAIDDETMARLRAEAGRAGHDRPSDPDADILAAWGERARAWAEIAGVFGDLGAMLGRGFDLSIRMLKRAGWLEILALRELIERLPEVREIVQQLGRLHAATEGESVAEKLLVPVRRIEEERREVRTPRAPTETRGIERSGEISRMLPAEAAMLGHPRLRLLWHARRAERALLTYRVEGVVMERLQVEAEALEEVESRRPRPQRGPILAVIDTSGSMHGLPERVAKAVVLEALRTAHVENRRCFLYAYGGPSQLLEHELSLTEGGLGSLMSFLSLSFGGGTDIGAMTTVVERLKQEGWKKADVVLVTDGEWAAPTGVIAGVAAARGTGTRFHGVQVGNRGRTGLHSLCDPVHVFQDWAALGGW
jgi:uncharacterized protein with von Willebrand factor type A (vWA) domain